MLGRGRERGGDDRRGERRPLLLDLQRQWVRLRARPYPRSVARLRMGVGAPPLSQRWGQRGRVIHRYYIEKFLLAHAAHVRGQCLEFQEDSYTSRFGGSRVASLDILHETSGNPCATLVADLTRPNLVTSEQFDCIICTQVLHLVDRPEKMVAELVRILRPGGVLLVAVPNITVDFGHWTEYRRYTALGLEQLLADAFGSGPVRTHSFGNSLVAAGELRGLAVRDFRRSELDFNDPRFGLVTCGVARKDGASET